MTDDNRLEMTLDKWKESSEERVSWKKVLHMLVELELHDMHQKVMDFLQRDDIILKYTQTYKWVYNAQGKTIEFQCNKPRKCLVFN